ncbi:MAG: hypothetical protein NDI63_06375 [Pseudobdellovibrio sp.]|nr:hypothetical protein [Pseudobdellovibrio sp.]
MSLFSKLLLSFAILLLIPGCISNIFKEPKPTFSNEVVLPEFNSGFNQLNDNVYPAWKSKDTGNVISIVSDCNDGNFSLKSIHSLMSDSLDLVKVLEEKPTTLNGRKSYYKVVRGEIEGKAIEIQSYSLQHNKCTYVTSLAGNPEKVKLNQEHFKNFLQKIDFKK